MQNKIEAALKEMNKVVLDKPHELRLAISCLFAKGHLLIEDVPGVGKTTLVKALSKVCGLQTKRVQFTIDLLPADLLGTTLYNQKSAEFNFNKGPIFTQLLLADELNRASPRTQSALLEAMEEDSITIDGSSYKLPQPFYVVATQNPLQQIGTFPLPESQLDRFMMSIKLNYPKFEVETQIFKGKDPKQNIYSLSACLNETDFAQIFTAIDQIKVSDLVAKYVSLLLDTSRKISETRKGGQPLSTRAGLLMIRAAKAWAYLESRDYITPDDIQVMLIPVFAHRLGGSSGVVKGREWVEQLKKDTPVPA